MKSCSLHHSVLFLFILVPVADQTLTSLTTKLHQPATLTCNQKCPGLMEWKMFGNPDVVARCDQTSCFSKEEFKISHDHYQNGNLDLVIRSVDFSKRTIFTCYCGDTPVCGVRLIIEPLVSQVQKKSGEDLVLDLPIREPMAVVYKNKHSTDLSGEWICTLTYGSLRCGTDYKQRASLSHTELTLRELKESDSGVYIIRDMKNKEIIHTYAVSVEEYHPQPLEKPERPVSDGTIVAAAVIPPLVVFGVIGIIFYMWKMKKIEDKEKLPKERLLNDEEEGAQRQGRSNSDERISQLMKLIMMVDKLVQQFGIREVRGSISRDITAERVLRKKLEMEEFIHKWNSENPDMNELNEWWEIKKSELDEILAQCRRERSERLRDLQNGEALVRQRGTEPYSVSDRNEGLRIWSYPSDNWQGRPPRTRSDDGSYHRRTGNRLMQMSLLNVKASRKTPKLIIKVSEEADQ